VEDSGIGIPEPMFETIFQRFRQIDYSHTRKFGGSGLGLSISKAYIELMGGKIWVTSQIDKGSTFYFTTPFIKKAGIAQQSSSHANYTFDKPIHIIVAEDEDFNFMLLVELLCDKNIILRRAENGLDALELFKSNQDYFDLILMDLKMPIMDGFEATKKIREFNRKIPIVALTAYTLGVEKDRAILSGCTDFISKPIKTEELMAIIVKCLNP
jgi:CheY-like chemotaxis protein